MYKCIRCTSEFTFISVQGMQVSDIWQKCYMALSVKMRGRSNYDVVQRTWVCAGLDASLGRERGVLCIGCERRYIRIGVTIGCDASCDRERGMLCIGCEHWYVPALFSTR